MDDAPVGAKVLFLSPTQNAILEGYIVQRAEMQEMFGDYEENPNYGYSADTVYYQIRVYAVRDLLEDVEYHAPTVCKVPETKVQVVIDEDAEFDPSQHPTKSLTLDTFQD